MTVRFPCPQCGKKLKAADEFVGQETVCAGCGARATVPMGSPRAHASDGGPEERFTVRKSKRLNVEDLVDMTAMVDIVFFLLIFFMVTSMQGIYSSIAVPTPDAQKTSAKGRRTVADFESDGNYAIVRVDRDDTVWFDGAEVPSEQELLVKLRAARQSPAAPNKLLVLGSSDARHGTVVMVLDAGTDVGMEEVRLSIDDDL